jgi:hypothetical protein
MEGSLYLLSTDQGYMRNRTVAWELLNEISGNTDMVSPIFSDPKNYVPPDFGISSLSLSRETNEQSQYIGTDELIAKQMQDEENQRVEGRIKKHKDPSKHYSQQQNNKNFTGQKSPTESSCIIM